MKVCINVVKTLHSLTMECDYFTLVVTDANGNIGVTFKRNRNTKSLYRYTLNPVFGNWLSSFFSNRDVFGAINTGEYSFYVDSTVEQLSWYTKKVVLYKPLTDNIFFFDKNSTKVFWFSIISFVKKPRKIKFIGFKDVSFLPGTIAYETKMELYGRKQLESGKTFLKMFNNTYKVKDFYFMRSAQGNKVTVIFGDGYQLLIDVSEIKGAFVCDGVLI